MDNKTRQMLIIVNTALAIFVFLNFLSSSNEPIVLTRPMFFTSPSRTYIDTVYVMLNDLKIVEIEPTYDDKFLISIEPENIEIVKGVRFESGYTKGREIILLTIDRQKPGDK